MANYMSYRDRNNVESQLNLDNIESIHFLQERLTPIKYDLFHPKPRFFDRPTPLKPGEPTREVCEVRMIGAVPMNYIKIVNPEDIARLREHMAS